MNWIINTQGPVESKPTSLPLKKNPRTYQQIVIMEGGNEDMEVNVTMQPNDKSIRTESDQFLEDQSELDYELAPNQRPLPIQETFVPREQASIMLSTAT